MNTATALALSFGAALTAALVTGGLTLATEKDEARKERTVQQSINVYATDGIRTAAKFAERDLSKSILVFCNSVYMSRPGRTACVEKQNQSLTVMRRIYKAATAIVDRPKKNHLEMRLVGQIVQCRIDNRDERGIDWERTKFCAQAAIQNANDMIAEAKLRNGN